MSQILFCNWVSHINMVRSHNPFFVSEPLNKKINVLFVPTTSLKWFETIWSPIDLLFFAIKLEIKQGSFAAIFQKNRLSNQF